MKKKRLLTLLVLLITAATGVWAEAWTGGTYTATTNETLSAINVGSSATLTINSNVTVTVNGGITINSGATLTVTGPGTLVVTGAKGNDGGNGDISGGTGGTGGVAISGNIIVQGGAVVTATGGNGGNGGNGNGGKGGNGGNGGNAFAGTLTYKDGTVTANGGSGGSGGWGELEIAYASSGSAGKAFADANSVSFQTDYILTSNGSAIQTIGGQKQITIAAPPVAVTGVTLPSTATVTLGDPVALTAAVAPADATDKKVKWTVTAGTDKVKLYQDADCKTEVGTEATDALTVYAKGLAVGEATVKVESNEDATKTATCAVTAKHGTYAVAMKAGVTDGDLWTAKAGQDGQYQAMPLKGVEGGTKPVELKYAGDGDTWTSGTFADFMADMQPGTYRLTATPKDETSPYDGTVTSGEFTLVEKYDLVVKPADEYSKNGLDAVTVGSESVTIDATTGEATKNGIDPGTEVKIKAKRGYVIEKVEAKKVDPAKVYLKWNSTQKKLVATEMPATYNTVENASTNVNWQAGTYVVEGNVTINARIRLYGNVDLIIKDGAKLTVNSYIYGDDKNLRIFGQAQMTGELVVNCSGPNDQAISQLPTLEVHSAKVTATASGNNRGGFINIATFNVYGGLVDAKNTGSSGFGIRINSGGSMNIYGGEVKAEGKGNGTLTGCGFAGDDSNNKATVTVYGGKIWSGSAEKTAFISVNLLKGAGFTGKIETSADNSDWAEYTGDETPDSKYVRVGY